MYRVGLLVDGVCVHKIFADLIAWARRQPDVEVAALIVLRSPHQPGGKFGALREMVRRLGLYGAVSRLAFARVVRLEQALAGLGRSDHARLHDVGHDVASHLEVHPIVSKSGFVYRFADEDLRRIRELDLDLLVRAGSGILKGDILSAAKRGILSIHHGDNRINRGGPPGFWEVMERQPCTGFVIQRLTEELDGGEVLLRGSMPTEFLYSRNQAMLFERSAIPLQNTIRKVLRGDAVAEPPHIYAHRLYTYPLLGDTIRYVAKTVWFWCRALVRRRLRGGPRWSVAFLRGEWDRAVLWRGKVIPNPPGHFLADPFALTAADGGRYIFAEDYDYAARKGSIAAYRVGEGGDIERLGIALEESFHLSFPYIFRHGGTLYMCPETTACRQIRLYRCVSFPLQWELDRVLLEGIEAADTVIFPFGDRWGMLTSVDSCGLGGPCELHGFVADDPLGAWTRIGDGPLFIDASRGRNGGLLRKGNMVFRVAQWPGFNVYGRGFSVYRIDRMDEHGYAETKVQDVEPNFRKGIDGTHHLHNDGDLVVFDFVKNERPR